MAARQRTQKIVQYLRDLTLPKGKRLRTNVVSPTLCTKIVNHLDLNDYKNTHIIDMNPGAGLWSEALYKHLNPKRHILLEPDASYYPPLEEMTARCPNASLVKLNGHDWETYDAIMNGPFRSPVFPDGYTPFEPANVPLEDGLNHDILFTGNLTNRNQSQRLVSQFIEACSGQRTWLQKYGRIRFLLWMFDNEKERIFPRIMQSRMRASVLADTLVEIHEVAGTGTVRKGQGFSMSILERVNAKGEEKYKRQIEYMNSHAAKYEDRREYWRKRGENLKSAILNFARADAEELKMFQARFPKLASYTLKYPHLDNVDFSKLSLQDFRDLLKTIQEDPPKQYAMGVEKRFSDDAFVASEQGLSKRSGSFQPTADQAALFAEYEQTHIQFHQLTRIARSVPDEMYALSLDPPLLQAWRDDKYDYPKPVKIGKSDVYPDNQLALMDFQPTLPPEYLRPEDTSLAIARFEMYDWMVRILFSTRAQTVKSALAALAPGGACILDELGPEGEEMGKKRVRVLTVDELVKLAWAWEQWDFKPEELKWGEVSRLEEQKQALGFITT